MMDEERRDPEIRVEHVPGPEDERVEEIFPPVVEGVPPGTANERAPRNPGAIRAEDTEPYLALQYVARLFKIAAIVVIVALTAEVIAGVAMEGMGALFPLFAEVIKGIVLAAILWGAGDLTILMIDVGHDVRAARVLLGRISARGEAEEHQNEDRPGAP
ncbi:MAG TPA: hypothetical protein VFL93_06810 [Longimicrobiaceae bacterium]|jgi:hypothetical protein|nr:hypothetical protein [Longimicrobiaceae bacterium]